MRHLDDVTRDLLEALRNDVAMNRAKGDDFENQQVQGSLREVGSELQSVHLDLLLKLSTGRVEAQGIRTKAVNSAETIGYEKTKAEASLSGIIVATCADRPSARYSRRTSYPQIATRRNSENLSPLAKRPRALGIALPARRLVRQSSTAPNRAQRRPRQRH